MKKLDEDTFIVDKLRIRDFSSKNGDLVVEEAPKHEREKGHYSTWVNLSQKRFDIAYKDVPDVIRALYALWRRYDEQSG